ncbi:MAG TPA: efflux RND transporter permease subunit, partial [Blastocatellia bacterium]
MIIGMVPMALGLGEGGEENAPLGRAVIGGLLVATVATLVFVPSVFSLLHSKRKFAADNGDSLNHESADRPNGEEENGNGDGSQRNN